MPVSGGEQLLGSLKQNEDEQPPIIIMTAHASGPNALRAMELGAYDFVTNPLDADEVLATTARAIKHAELQKEVDQLRAQRFQVSEDDESEPSEKARMVGSSPAWIGVFKAIGRAARTDVSVLLQANRALARNL